LSARRGAGSSWELIAELEGIDRKVGDIHQLRDKGRVAFWNRTATLDASSGRSNVTGCTGPATAGSRLAHQAG